MSNNGESLIEDLVSNPSLFFNEGRSYHLLQAYFKGLPLDTLIPLLQSEQKDIQKTAVWIISELGNKACSLISYVVPLVNNELPYLRYYALECILLCAEGRNVSYFKHIFKAIEDEEDYIRIFAMQLFSNASDNQIGNLIHSMADEKAINIVSYRLGIEKLLHYSKLNHNEILDMLNSIEPGTQKVGAMIAKKRYHTDSDLLNYALSSNNSDVSEFSRMELEILKE